MKVDLITETNSDLTVVNAARISFDKGSKWETKFIPDNPDIENSTGAFVDNLSQADSKLITYLANHNHWTPFAHPQEVFELYLDTQELLMFLVKANLSGFEFPTPDISFTTENVIIKIRGSLYAWLTNIQYLPIRVSTGVQTVLSYKYPTSTKAVLGATLDMDVSYIKNLEKDNIDHLSVWTDELESYTLRIHCPIFVKRQLETHRRNMVITDIEDFSQNEVSRRYIDSEPEIYHPNTWRIQAQDKKQGSSGVLDPLGVGAILTDSNYNHHTHNATIYYNKFNELGITHEQSRMILPQSTYTTFWWTGSLKSFKRVMDLRLQDDVQDETRAITEMIKEIIQ